MTPSSDQNDQRAASEALRGNRITLRSALNAWGVRVVVVAVVLMVLNYFLGPLEWMWGGLAIYALISLGTSLLLMRLQNRQIDRLGRAAGLNDTDPR